MFKGRKMDPIRPNSANNAPPQACEGLAIVAI